MCFYVFFLVLFKSVGRLGWVWDEMLGVKGWGWGQKGGGIDRTGGKKKHKAKGPLFLQPGYVTV